MPLAWVMLLYSKGMSQPERHSNPRNLRDSMANSAAYWIRSSSVGLVTIMPRIRIHSLAPARSRVASPRRGAPTAPRSECTEPRHPFPWPAAVTKVERLLFGLLVQLALAVHMSPLEAQDLSATIVGIIKDSVTDVPVPEVSLVIRGVGITARTGDDGVFRIGGITVGTHLLLIRRLGFAPRDFRFTITRNQLREFDLGVISVAPVRTVLDPITAVELAPMGPMDGFYERLGRGWGQFVTRADIEKRNPTVSSNLLRGIPGVQVVCQGNVCTPSMYRALTGITECRVQYFLDGMPAALRFNMDDIPPNQIEGIEVYRGPSETPAAFLAGRTMCGVIAIWTRGAAGSRGDPGTPHRVSVGLHVAGAVRDRSLSQGRVGGQLAIDLFGPVDLYLGFNVPVGDDGSQVLLNVRLWPLGRQSSWYVGGGLTRIKMDAASGEPASRGATTYPMLLAGVSPRVRRLRPFAELHLVDVAHPRDTDVILAMGVSIRIGQ